MARLFHIMIMTALPADYLSIYFVLTHSLTHSAAMQFKCDECAYECHQSTHLVKHKLQHAGDDKKCLYCDAAYDYAQSLHKHIKTNHPEKVGFVGMFVGLIDF